MWGEYDYTDMWKFVPDTNCLHFASAVTNNINQSICNGDSVTFGGSVYHSPGSYFETLTAINGCDSIVTLNLTVKPLPVDSWFQKQTVVPCHSDIALTGGTPAGGYYSGPFVVGDSIISPSVDSIFMVSYIYTDSNGCSASASLQFHSLICTGISDIDQASDIHLYPNPNNGSFILSAPQAVGSIYTIYDMLGQLVQQDVISSESMPLSLQGSAAGIYTLEVHTALSSRTIRFTVMK